MLRETLVPPRVGRGEPSGCFEPVRPQQLGDSQTDERGQRDHADREDCAVAEEGQRRANDEQRDRKARTAAPPRWCRVDRSRADPNLTVGFLYLVAR